MYYAEFAHMDRWSPTKLYEMPSVNKDGRWKRVSSIGPRVRKLGSEDGKPLYALKIAKAHEGLSLNELHALYSPDREQTEAEIEDDGFVTVVPTSKGCAKVEGDGQTGALSQDPGEYMDKMAEGPWL